MFAPKIAAVATIISFVILQNFLQYQRIVAYKTRVKLISITLNVSRIK